MTAPGLRGIFVTGTDTGVGKTTIGAGLLRLARRRGLTPIPFKPAETGCDPIAADARVLWLAARPPTAEAEACLYAFPLPAAPAQAAAAAGVRIDPDRILSAARTLADRGDFLLVEGAGGLLVPYTDDLTAADLARALGLPLLVVARTALGTINHTALTLREAARTDLTLAGLILNRTTATAAPHENGNPAMIRQLTGATPLGTFPWVDAPSSNDPDRLADALAAALGEAGIQRLLGASL